MAKVVELEASGCNVQILVDDGPPTSGASRKAGTGDGGLPAMLKARLPIEAATDVVAQLAGAFSTALSKVDKKPETVEVSFGLEASGEFGNFLVSKVAGKTNFDVKLTWKFGD